MILSTQWDTDQGHTKGMYRTQETFHIIALCVTIPQQKEAIHSTGTLIL